MKAQAPVTLFYDGSCNLCNHTMKRLRERDKHHRLQGVDISKPTFDQVDWGFTASDDLQGKMHAITPGGEVVRGMDAIRLAYEAVGRGWMLGWTKLPVVSKVSDKCYAWFARNRHSLTGRTKACDSGTCKL